MSKKSILLIGLLAVVLYVFFNANFIDVRNHEKYSEELSELLSQKYFSSKIIGKQYSVSDILITRNEMGENFMCGVNANYSLNSDDTAEALSIECYNLAGYMTLAFINTPYWF